MPIRKKGSNKKLIIVKKNGPNKKLIIAIVLAAILATATAAVVYVSLKPSSSATRSSLVGVQVGDTFTYNITGSCSGPVSDIDYPGFYELNDTQYYKVTITGINGSSVTLETDWVFTNGTDVQQQQTIGLYSGALTDQTGFWGLYPAKLKVGDPIYPNYAPPPGFGTVFVNATVPQPYASGNRILDYYGVSTTEEYSLDPTQSTQRILYDEVYFDQQTGILTNWNEIQEYNNPQVELEVIYALTSTNVWNI